jgi:glycosyltransferase involved in cell wall biosynthesis
VAAPAQRPLCVHLLPDTQDAGAENQCRYLLEGLRDSGEVDLELAYFGEGRAHETFAALGIPMLQIARRGRFRTDAYGRTRRLRRAYLGRPPALLHTWMPEANVVGMWAARSWPQTRVVITQRGSWNELDYPAIMRLQRLHLGRADAAVSNSPGGAEMLASIGMEPERISVIVNGIPPERVAVDADRERTREALGWTDAEAVAWVGRAVDAETAAQKDLTTLMAAAAELHEARPAVTLELIGATAEELRARGIELPDWAHAHGWQPRPAELLDAADLLVISSRLEGNSNVAGEALLLGLPVATTDCGGHCAVVAASGGRVVAVGDPGALARACAELLASPPARTDVKAAAAELLSVDRMVGEHLELYRRLLSEPRSPSSSLPRFMSARQSRQRS